MSDFVSKIFPAGLRTYSLEEYCMLSIVNNFNAIFNAFKSRDSNLFNKSFEFIARKYSSQLFKMLKRRKSLKSEHFDWLINPYIKQLDLNGIDVSLVNSLIDSLKTYGKDILMLRTGFRDIDEDLLRKLVSCMPKLRFLAIIDNETQVSGVFEEIGRTCPFIERLYLDCEINNNDLMDIFKNSDGHYYNRTQLKHLRITKTDRKLYEGISFVLDHAPMMKILCYIDIGGVIYHKHRNDTSSRIYELSQLTYISFTNSRRDYPLPEAIKVCTDRCPCVSTLCIISSTADVGEIKQCTIFKQIVELNLVSVESICIDKLLQLLGHKLKKIKLVSCDLNVETLIKSCPKLEHLDIVFARISPYSDDSSALPLPKLPGLKYLLIGGDVHFDKNNKIHPLKLILNAAECLKELIICDCQGVDEILDSSGIILNSLERFVLKKLPKFDVTILFGLISNGNLSLLHIEKCPSVTFDVYKQLLKICRKEKVGTHIFWSAVHFNWE